MQVLIQQDGQIRRSALADEVDWSGQRVEAVISQMESNGEIRVIEISNQTIIVRPGYEPTDRHIQ